MESFSWFSKKKNDKWWILVALSLISIFLIWKAIIDSGHILFCIICLILWVVAYFSFGYIHKKMVERPASLWIYSKKYPIIIQYTPPKWINPAEAWLLYNLSVEPTDLTSLIYQWKFEKLIDIKTFKWENSKKEYVKLIKKADMPLTRPLFESEIFNSIFNMWDVKIIEWAFQLRYALMLEDLEFHWIQKWGVKSGDKKYKKIEDGTKNMWTFLFIAYYFILIISSILEENNISISFATFLWLLIIVLLLWVWILLYDCNKSEWWSLKFTEKWAGLASQIIGYSQFIKSCDENKIKLLLEEDPLFIDRTLPYATAFWMETEFLKKISPLRKDWNARYVRWQKVPSWAWVIRFFIKNDNSLL